MEFWEKPRKEEIREVTTGLGSGGNYNLEGSISVNRGTDTPWV